ncbi:MAG TPA: ABC transporter ATP-binding protein [Candidatus Angelobacter sp.]|nr:ABC transporter ATP-binding protein [Candidatus Angelobacter sp.]
MTPALLVVDGLHVRYDGADGRPALQDVSLQIAQGEFVAIVGPSGSGKTTLLRCIAGLQGPTRGEVRLNGKVVTDVPDDLALVFQDYGRSLYPWLRIGENVGLPLRRLRLPDDERRDRIGAALAEVGLSDVAERYPYQLSGGMQQRVAIARAIAYRPQILLMDEPFASVDAQTRADLQDMALQIWASHDSTVVFVTHDIDESVYLADRVVVLSDAPATVAAEIRINLTRPRDQIETRAAPAFVSHRAEVARLIHREPPVRQVP